MHDFEPATSTSGKACTLEPEALKPLKDGQEKAVRAAVMRLPTDGRRKVEIWREGKNVRISTTTRPTPETI